MPPVVDTCEEVRSVRFASRQAVFRVVRFLILGRSGEDSRDTVLIEENLETIFSWMDGGVHVGARASH